MSIHQLSTLNKFCGLLSYLVWTLFYKESQHSPYTIHISFYVFHRIFPNRFRRSYPARYLNNIRDPNLLFSNVTHGVYREIVLWFEGRFDQCSIGYLFYSTHFERISILHFRKNKITKMFVSILLWRLFFDFLTRRFLS